MANAVANREFNDISEVFTQAETNAASAQPRFNKTEPDVLERAISDTHSPMPSMNFPTPSQKAAIIVRLMQDGATDVSLADLGDQALTELVRGMARLSFVDEQTVLSVIQEFLSDLDSFALYFKPGLDGAIAQMGTELPESVTTNLKSEPTAEAVEDPWSHLLSLDTEALLGLLQQETPQVTAVVLSKLHSVKAAELLSELSPERASSAMVAALGVGLIGDETLLDIGKTLLQRSFDGTATGGLPGTPIERVGAMLNFAPGAKRESLLRDLEALDQETSEQVRQIMFTFSDIPDRVEIKDIPKVARAVENSVVVTALAGAMTSDKDSAEFILSNLSKRLSEQLIEEIGEVGEVKQKDADTAMNAMIQAIRDLEDSGEITLISPQE